MILSGFVERRFWCVALTLLLVMGLMMFASVRLENQTADEAVYLAAGYSYLETGDYRLNPEHPPLAKLISALPLIVFQPELPFDPRSEVWPDESEIGRKFLYTNSVHADTLLLAGRTPIIVTTLIFGLVLALWTRRRFGAPAALLALTLFAFEPVILAHGRYATNDLLAAFTIFLSCITWSAWLERPSRRNLIIAGIALGLALGAKYSTLILLPVQAVLLVISWRRGSTPIELRRGLVSLLVIGLLSVSVLLILYQFEFGPVSTGRDLNQARTESTGAVQQGGQSAPMILGLIDLDTPLGRALRWIARNVPVPAFHFPSGVLDQLEHNRRGHAGYLLGHVSQQGSPFYFPVAFAVKSSTGLLLLTCLAAALAFRHALSRGVRKIPLRWLVIAVPPALFFLACLACRVNIGVRYLLPIYPFLFVFIGAVLFHLTPRRTFGHISAVGIVAAAIVVVESAASYPDYLAFFNSVAGGPAQGPHYLLDSNIDWGQNLKKLKAYLDARGIDVVCLDYWGAADSDYYGIRSIPLRPETPPQPGCTVAVSVNKLYTDSAYQWLLERTPTATIGDGMYVYEPVSSRLPPTE